MDLPIVHVDIYHSQTKFKNLKKQEIQVIFTKMNLIKPAFSTIWLMGILNI